MSTRGVTASLVLGALVLAGCVSVPVGTASDRTARPDAMVPAQSLPTLPVAASLEPRLNDPLPFLTSVAPPTRIRPKGRLALAAKAFGRSLAVWTHPGPGARIRSRIATINPFGQRMSFLVRGMVRAEGGSTWARIHTGQEPNGAAAWVRAVDVRLLRMKQRIVVDLSERRLQRFVHGKLRTELSVAIGDEDTPTVPGRYFVWARVRYRQIAGPYGKLALGLSGFSEAVRFGPTTPGRLAIHGTDDPRDRGRSVSLGCIRVWNRDIGRLWDVPMGTPVVIRP